ncbi:MAG: hydantoinase B/oxoprolinase family protein [Chloroflexi bacterium]|nr:hydantoinase B/oxoprolinase family protein [Chloroflexota bacterium]
MVEVSATRPPASSNRVDPIRFEVIRNALHAATEEMSMALQRSAFSTNIKTRLDFSSAFLDRDFRMVAQSFSQPSHLTSLKGIVPHAVREYGPENFYPGDCVVVNDPHRWAGHLNDITFISPFYYHDQLEGYVANVAHHVDVGGGAPASIGAFTEVYQEGFNLPVVKLVERGEIVQDIFKLTIANIRSKKETAGDFRAQIAANMTGVRRLAAIFDRFGVETVTFYIDHLLDYTERRVRHEIATKLPRGTFRADGYIDSDGITGEPVHLVCAITVHDDRIAFDFTGTDPQRRAPMNSTPMQTFATCTFLLKCLIDQDITVNDGLYRCIEWYAPKGSALYCVHPGPVVGGWEVSMRLADVMFKALSGAIPERLPAGSKAMICHSGFGGADPRTGEYYCFLETLAGGYGGRFGKDGPDAVQTHLQNTQNAPVEETEIGYPVHILQYGLVPDSEGAGKWRGGLGLLRDYQFYDHDPVFTILADRERWGPWGLHGGEAGQKAYYVLNPGTVTERTVGSKVTVQMTPADVMRMQTCGGGGYGRAVGRDPALVVEDVRNEMVSLERARTVYGVAIDPTTWSYDPEETARLRAARTD